MRFRVGVKVAVVLVLPGGHHEAASDVFPRPHTSVLEAESLMHHKLINSQRASS